MRKGALGALKIKSLHIEHFMLFDSLDIEWSPDVNIISGDNSTGKTTLLKALYAMAKAQEAAKAESLDAQKSAEAALAQKLLGCFRPDGMKIGRLVARQKGGGAAASLTAVTARGSAIAVSFTCKQDKRVKLILGSLEECFSDAVYIPPKEIISSAGHFQSLYEEHHLDFEEMYCDLARLLLRPLKKELSEGQRHTLKRLEKMLKGCIAQNDGKFYLRSGNDLLEMGLLSDGYRKLATLACLIQSGSLDAGSLLFWDEPEANMNPAMIQPLSEAIMELAEMGVQVFIATHDYFVQQAFNMYNVYPRLKLADVGIKFISLYDSADGIACEIKDTVGDLEHNLIMEEFDNIYDRELKYIDDNF